MPLLKSLLSFLICFSVFAEPISAKLVADVDSVTPGETIKVGVLFDMQPDWHIYWKNPGDSGLPTIVNINSEYLAGDLMWPAPVEFKQSGNILAYGYSQQVLLFRKLKVPVEYSERTIEILASAKWLGCSKSLCVPGRKELKLSLPVKSQVTKSAETEIFSKAESNLAKEVKIEAKLEGDSLKISRKDLLPEQKIVLEPVYGLEMSAAKTTENYIEYEILKKPLGSIKLQGIILGGKTTEEFKLEL